MGNKAQKTLSLAYSILNDFYLKLKNITSFLTRDLFFFENDHIHNVVETLPEIVEFEVEHENFALTLSKVVQINVQRGSVDLTLLKVLNSNVDIDNVASTLI